MTGRTLDVVYGAQGEAIAPFFFTHLSRDLPGIRNFRIVQEERGRARLEVVLAPSAAANTAERLKQLAAETLGSSLALDVVVVASLPLTASGKLRFIESRVGRTAR